MIGSNFRLLNKGSQVKLVVDVFPTLPPGGPFLKSEFHWRMSFDEAVKLII